MIFTLEDARKHLRRYQSILVTGGFDPLHYGHVRYFAKAKELATRYADLFVDLAVVVAVAPDSYVTNKHPLLQTLEHRMEIVSAIRWIDYVIPQGEETAATAIRAVRPLIFLKGSDWEARGLPRVEMDALAEVGARVEYVPVQPVSSSELLIDFFWRTADQMGRH
jgi:D-beta-D-heptose 7-phosphate kinase/D-beta-D-heptose 1-phosphate adenosyltransferase